MSFSEEIRGEYLNAICLGLSTLQAFYNDYSTDLNLIDQETRKIALSIVQEKDSLREKNSMLTFMKKRDLMPISSLRAVIERSSTDQEALKAIQDENLLVEAEDSILEEAVERADQKNFEITSCLIESVWKRHQ